MSFFRLGFILGGSPDQEWGGLSIGGLVLWCAAACCYLVVLSIVLRGCSSCVVIGNIHYKI